MLATVRFQLIRKRAQCFRIDVGARAFELVARSREGVAIEGGKRVVDLLDHLLAAATNVVASSQCELPSRPA